MLNLIKENKCICHWNERIADLAPPSPVENFYLQVLHSDPHRRVYTDHEPIADYVLAPPASDLSTTYATKNQSSLIQIRTYRREGDYSSRAT